MKRLLLLSGPIAVGKSAVAKHLVQEHQFEKMGSGQYLMNLANRQGTSTSRADLQLLGDELDEQTGHRWLIDEIAKVRMAAAPQHASWLFDSVRKRRQVFNFKEIYGRLALHVHFNASEEVLEKRYQTRLGNGGEYAGNAPYYIAKSHPNEIEARSLIEVADIVVDVSQTGPEKAVAEILKQWDIGGKHASGGSD